MSYYAVDMNGYLGDIASIGGLRALHQFSDQANNLPLYVFLRDGRTKTPKELGESLQPVHSAVPAVELTLRGLEAAANRAKGILILTDGTSDDDEDLRAAAKPLFGLAFRRTNKETVAWAKEHAAKLVTQVTETTRDAIREAVVAALEGESKHLAVADIIAAVGDDRRALLIAKQEARTAVNEGQRQMWGQAAEEGLISTRSQRVWVANEAACQRCEDLDGATAPLDGQFPDEGGDGPPLHIGCGCWEELVEA